MIDIRTNVIYVTTRCNLDCDYCYERANRLSEGFSHKTVTSKEIDAFVEEVSVREADVNSCVVIFGGEPLLRPDLVWELIDKFKARKGSKVTFDLITNGTLITPEIAAKLKEYGNAVQVEVSYDVSGQSRRIFVDGSSSDADVLDGLARLREAGVPYVISYVATTTNISNVLRDVVYCIVKLQAHKVTLRWANTELQDAGIQLDAFRKEMRPKFVEIFRWFGVPICEETCGICQRCDRSHSGNNYFVPETGFIKQASYVNAGFSHFSNDYDDPAATRSDLKSEGLPIDLKALGDERPCVFVFKGQPPVDYFTLEAALSQQFLTAGGIIKSLLPDPSCGIAQLSVGDKIVRNSNDAIELLQYKLVE
jgi:sulfatase maturation enzyme AslB (radical SAM superfamily)